MKFDAAMADSWIGRYLQTCVPIYSATVQSTSDSRQANAVPKLDFGSRWVIPEPRDTDDLVMIPHNSLGLTKP